MRAEAGGIFLAMENAGNIEVAYKFGLDRYFNTEPSMRSAVTRAYNLVLENPLEYEITTEKAAYIQGIVTSRQIMRKPETLREAKEIEEMDISKMVLNTRNMTASLIQRKLEYLDEHPRALQEESLANLVKVFTGLFDKGQIIQGAATEHIAVMSKIDNRLSPEEAMKAIMQMREQFMSKSD